MHRRKVLCSSRMLQLSKWFLLSFVPAIPWATVEHITQRLKFIFSDWEVLTGCFFPASLLHRVYHICCIMNHVSWTLSTVITSTLQTHRFSFYIHYNGGHIGVSHFDWSVSNCSLQPGVMNILHYKSDHVGVSHSDWSVSDQPLPQLTSRPAQCVGTAT